MPGKRVAFGEETWAALDLLARGHFSQDGTAEAAQTAAQEGQAEEGKAQKR
jgi:hypothetical protein